MECASLYLLLSLPNKTLAGAAALTRVFCLFTVFKWFLQKLRGDSRKHQWGSRKLNQGRGGSQQKVSYWAVHFREQLELSPQGHLREQVGHIPELSYPGNKEGGVFVHQLLSVTNWGLLLRDTNSPAFLPPPWEESRLRQLEVAHWPRLSSTCSWHS